MCHQAPAKSCTPGCHLSLAILTPQKIATLQPGQGRVVPQKKIESKKVQISSLPPEDTITPLERGCLWFRWRIGANTQLMHGSYPPFPGDRLQFATKLRRFNGAVLSVKEGENAEVIQDEIDSLLHKRSIIVVLIEVSKHGFYSHYFLIPKKGGSALCSIPNLFGS